MAKANDTTHPAFIKQPFIYDPTRPREIDTGVLRCQALQCSSVLVLLIEELQAATKPQTNLIDALYSAHDNVLRIHQMIDHAEGLSAESESSGQGGEHHG